MATDDNTIATSTTSGTTKSHRSAIVHKQHSLDEQVRQSQMESGQSQGENKHPKQHRPAYHKQHTTGHDSPIIHENHEIDKTNKHPSKSDSQNDEKWVAASRTRHGKK